MLCTLLLMSVLAAQITTPATQPEDWYYWTDEFTVSPRAVDEASAQIHLRPEWVDPLPGNAALDYLRAADLAEPTGKDDEGARGIDRYAGEDLDKMDWDAVADALALENEFYPLLRIATRRIDCAWGSPFVEQGYDVKVPEMNTFRHMANVLLLDAQLAITARQAVRESPEIWQWRASPTQPVTRPAAQVIKLDDVGVASHVAENVRWLLALTEDLGNHPNLISPLVAGGIEAAAYKNLRLYIASPNATNVLPALQELGVRQYDLRRAIATDRQSFYATVPALQRFKIDGTITLAEIEVVVAKLNRFAMPEEGGPIATTLEELYAAAGGIGEVPQVVAAHMVDAVDTRTSTLLREFDRPLVLHNEGDADNMPNWLPMLDLDSFYRVRTTMARIQREPIMLKIVEGLRDHAARAGKLPETLDELGFFLPLDPASGKAFEYARTADGFILTGLPAGDTRASGRRYIVTLRPPAP